MSEPIQKFKNYDQLLKQAQEKKDRHNSTKASLVAETSLDSFVTIDPTEELAMLDYYDSFNEVEIDPDVRGFWQGQQKAMLELKEENQEPIDEYMKAFDEWQDHVENMDDRKRSALGVNSYDQRIKEAKKGLAKATERANETSNNANLGKLFIGFITGGIIQDKAYDYRTIRDALDGVKSAQKSLDSAKEAKSAFQESLDKLEVKEQMALRRMLDAKEKMARNRAVQMQKAKALDEISKEQKGKLAPQYQLIDQYLAIQKFKENVYSDPRQAISTRQIIKSRNPELADSLDNFQTLPNNTLRISLNSPLQELPVDKEKLNEITKSIEDTKRSLPYDIESNNLQAEIDALHIDPKADISSQLQKIEEDMQNCDPTSKEYQQLEMKKNHLEIQAKVNAQRKNVEDLKKSIMDSPNPSQSKLQKLQAMQTSLKLLEEELNNDPYSKTLAGLRRLQELEAERDNFEAENRPLDTFNQIGNISTQLQGMSVPPGTLRISDIFRSSANSVFMERQSRIPELMERYRPKPLDYEKEQY